MRWNRRVRETMQLGSGAVMSPRTNSKFAWRFNRSRFEGREVCRLSMQTTRSPASSRLRHKWEPMNPAPPATSVRRSEVMGIGFLVGCGLAGKSFGELVVELLGAAFGAVVGQ